METPEWMQMGHNACVPSAGVWLKLGYRRIALLMLHVQVAERACGHAAAAQQPAALKQLVRAQKELAQAHRSLDEGAPP